LRECYAQGAARFGWHGRPLAPRQVRDENGPLVGWGLGTAIFPAIMFQGQARAVLRRDGTGLVEEADPRVNALGIKGVGEIAITGSAGAVANAVWHATGIRVRRFPIRIENLVIPATQPPRPPACKRSFVPVTEATPSRSPLSQFQAGRIRAVAPAAKSDDRRNRANVRVPAGPRSTREQPT
jgi:hypothetical protein